MAGSNLEGNDVEIWGTGAIRLPNIELRGALRNTSHKEFNF